MKHISDLTHSTSRKPSEPASTRHSDESKRKIQELFLLMKATWLNKYTSQFKTPDDVKLTMRVWLQAFHGIDKDILHEALTDLGLRLEWPPTLQQMKDHLRYLEARNQTIRQAHTPRLSRMRRTDIAETNISKMRSLLSRSRQSP